MMIKSTKIMPWIFTLSRVAQTLTSRASKASRFVSYEEQSICWRIASQKSLVLKYAIINYYEVQRISETS